MPRTAILGLLLALLGAGASVASERFITVEGKGTVRVELPRDFLRKLEDPGFRARRGTVRIRVLTRGPRPAQLFESFAKGRPFPDNRLVIRAAPGAREVYHTITLRTATVSKIEYSTGASDAADSRYDTHELEAISFTYQSIDHE